MVNLPIQFGHEKYDLLIHANPAILKGDSPLTYKYQTEL